MLDFTPAFDDIINKLKADLGANVSVYDTNVPLDVPKVTVNGMFSPYVVVSIGGGVQNTRSKHMVDVRMDTYLYWVVCTSVAPRDKEARELKADILKSLTGFVPTDAGQLTPKGGTAQGVANENKVPLIYQHRAMFEFSQNMQTE